MMSHDHGAREQQGWSRHTRDGGSGHTHKRPRPSHSLEEGRHWDSPHSKISRHFSHHPCSRGSTSWESRKRDNQSDFKYRQRKYQSHYRYKQGDDQSDHRHRQRSKYHNERSHKNDKGLSPVDEAVPISAHHSGAVSYTGGHDDNWKLGNFRTVPKDVYYTTEIVGDVTVLRPTEQLLSLHHNFTASLLTLSHLHICLLPCHILTSSHTHKKQTTESGTVPDKSIIAMATEAEKEKGAESVKSVTLNTGTEEMDTSPSEVCQSTSIDQTANLGHMESGSPAECNVDQTATLGEVEGGSRDELEPVDSNIPYNTVTEPPLVLKQPIPITPPPDPPQWHSYTLTLSPTANFQTGLTTISRESGELFKFRGFFFITRTPLQENLPVCRFQRYSGVYSIQFDPISTPNIFTMADATLFNEYLLIRLLELYDLAAEMRQLLTKLGGTFIPLFVRDTESCQEVLSIAEVLQYLLNSFQPLDDSCDVQSLKGQIIVDFSKRPHCLRVDDARQMRIKSATGGQRSVKFGHCVRMRDRARDHKDESPKKLKTQYYHLLSKKNRGLLSRAEHFKFVEMKRRMERQWTGQGEWSGGVATNLEWFSAKGYHLTGLCTDVVQHTAVLSTVAHHLLLHHTLTSLQYSLGYTFRDPTLLHRALTHPSLTTLTHHTTHNHLKTALHNCGLVTTVWLGTPGKPSSKGLKALMESMKSGDKGAWLEHNEQLEFLGDAVLEYITSMRLFHVAPPLTVGRLTQERKQLVRNSHLWQLSKQLSLSDHLLTNQSQELTEESREHATANCFEAVLGAVFVDSGDVDVVDGLFARQAFTKQEEFERWTNQSKHPLIGDFPDGDRHLVEQSSELKSVLGLEERLGLQFNHVQLLARALTHCSHSDTELVKGNYQRLEFLGDAILQFLVSKHVYHSFPSHHEGHLTMLRTALVHNKQLAALCQHLGLDQHIITSETEKLELSVKLQADLVESFMAALTLEKGLSATESFLQQHLYPRLLEAVRSSQAMDASTRLHQAAAYTCRQQGVSLELPVFKVSESDAGTSSNPQFTVSVFFEKKKIGSATAGSIKEARRLAGKESLKSSFLRIPPALKELLDDSPDQKPETQLN